MGMDSRIVRSLRLLEKNIGRSCTISQVADWVSLSLHHFHRMFVDEIGETPASYLRRIRMDNSAFRLRWSDEPIAVVAQSVGFHSRPAFARAFERRFGLSPARYRAHHCASFDPSIDVGEYGVGLRNVDSFRILAKRYVGSAFDVRLYWRDFFSRLPDDVPRTGLSIGRLHDDFRISDPDRVRYDCGIVIDDLDIPDTADLSRQGLHVLATHAGRYAVLHHQGHFEQVPTSYDVLCREALTLGCYVPDNEPMLELHTIPRHLQDKNSLSFNILLPLE